MGDSVLIQVSWIVTLIAAVAPVTVSVTVRDHTAEVVPAATMVLRHVAFEAVLSKHKIAASPDT